MTKASPTRLVKKGKITAPKAKRNLTKQELKEATELLRAAQIFKFASLQVQGNTAMVTDGQKMGTIFGEIARLLDNAKNLWMIELLQQCGYTQGEKVGVDMDTGVITYQ